MKVFIIRHGKDDSNYRGGRSCLDLTDEGKAQSEKLAQYIYAHNREFNITRIISSDLNRASATANFISEKLSIAVEYEPMLREMNNGDLAGMPNKDAPARYPGVFFNTLNPDEHYPNGESPREFYIRIEQWFANFCRTNINDNKNVVIVTHGGVIDIIYCIVNNAVWSNKSQLYKSSHCSMHILDLCNMQFEIENFVAE